MDLNITAAEYFNIGKNLIQAVDTYLDTPTVFLSYLLYHNWFQQISGAMLTYIIVMLQFTLEEKAGADTNATISTSLPA